MQLTELALYSHDDRRRTLRLRRGSLNVISGLSRTGKTELLKIIDFCAGRRTPNLAPGPITRSVSWFAASFEAADGRRVLVARPQPAGKSTQSAMLAVGSDVTLPPDASALEVNATVEGVRGALDDLLGLGGFDVEQFAGNRDRLRASVSHAIQFCLQAQTELISPAHLFHRGGDERVAADFRELFPYFVGAVDEELLDARRHAQSLRRRLVAVERRLAAAQAHAERTHGRDRALRDRAATLGLLEAEDGRDARAALRDLLHGSVPAQPAAQSPAAPLAELRAVAAGARAELRELRERRAALHRLDGDRDAHGGALRTQLGRLGVLEPLRSRPDEAEVERERADGNASRDGGEVGAADRAGAADAVDAASCPACGAQLAEPDATLAQLASDAAQLGAQLQALQTADRDVGPAERELDAAIAESQARVDEARLRLEAAQADDAAAAAQASAAEDRARLLGAIEEYLRGAAETSSAAIEQLTAQERQLSEEFQAVLPGTDRRSIDAELEARLAAMSINMTAWARRLGLEAADEGNVYIDRRTLNVAVGTPRGRVALEQMGSGANHVGYHLVAHLALHEHFVREARPVPRFVVFDQPSLPFFPRGVARDDEIGDVDWQEVRAMMVLADEVVSGLDGALQVLICDHAGFAGEPWFDAALVEDWHTGTKLVPTDWPER